MKRPVFKIQFAINSHSIINLPLIITSFKGILIFNFLTKIPSMFVFIISQFLLNQSSNFYFRINVKISDV